MKLADDALLLRRMPYGESSLVVHALTREGGRRHLIAKGVFRPRSRFFAALDLFDTLDLGWSESSRRDLGTLQRAEIRRRRHAIARSLERYRAGLTALELAGLATAVGRPAGGLFELLEAALDELLNERLPPALPLVVFELRFLQNLGLSPALERCAACGGPAPPVRDSSGVGAAPRREARVAFSAGAGGRLCRSCGEEARASGRRVGTLPETVLERAASLLVGRPLELPSPAELELVRDFVARFLEYHLETRPRSYRRFLAVPNRNAPRGAARA